MAAEQTTGQKSQKKSTQKSTKKSTQQKKSTQKKSTQQPSGSRASAPRAEARRRRTGVEVAEQAAQQLAELAGKDVEAVTGLERTDDGWQVEVEVLELRRVPNTTDVLATYLVTTDQDGELEGYRRGRRYVRGAAGEDDR